MLAFVACSSWTKLQFVAFKVLEISASLWLIVLRYVFVADAGEAEAKNRAAAKNVVIQTRSNVVFLEGCIVYFMVIEGCGLIVCGLS